MASPDVKISKKRRQEGDPESAKRKQKKQKKASLSAELDPEHEDTNGTEHLRADADPSPTDSPKAKKDKKKKKSKTEDTLPEGPNGADATAHASAEGSPEQSRKPKKSKKDRPAPDTLSEAPGAGRLTPPPTADEAKPKKSKKRDVDASQMSLGADGVQDEADASPAKPKKSKKKKEAAEDEGLAAQDAESKADSPEAKRKKRKDKSRDMQATPPPSSLPLRGRLATESPAAQRTPKLKTSKPRAPPPPVVMQEVARWVPLWPRGWNQPITAAIEQHFTPKLHRYDGEMGGVLLGYKNVCLNDRPTRKGAATQDSEAVKLLSVNEFGVGFCWLIADLELFLPKRGSWMEGELMLQNQGHVGVVCWDKFNASIEATRLPPKWSWVAAPEDELANEDFNMDLDGDEEGEQAGSATPLGHWVNENGEKVEGKLQFRIKNYDVGLSGDHSFLCIEGTMLDEQDENRLREKELKVAAGARGGIKRRPQRVLPEFGMTDFGVDEEAEKAKRWRKVQPKEEEGAEGEAEEEFEGAIDNGAEEGAEEGADEEAEAMDVEEEE